MWKPPQKTKEPENEAQAYDYAVFLLSLKLRTVGEMLEKMHKRGYTESVIEHTVEQLKSHKYIDDRRYAEIFLENLKAYRTFGYYGIKKKFMEKKLPKDLIESILTDGLPLEEEVAIGERFLKKAGFQIKPRRESGEELQYNTFAESGERTEKQKMANRLKSRGFRSEVISRLLF